MSVPSPEALSAEHLSRLDYARAQLRDPNLTPGESEAARSIVFDKTYGGDWLEDE